VNAEGLPVDLVPAQDPPGLGHQEEEDPVGEAEEVVVEGLGIPGELLAHGPPQEARAEFLEEALHRLPEALPDPLALLHGHQVVALHGGLVGGGGIPRQARAVQEAVDQGELAEAVLLHEGLEVHLQIGLAPHEGGLTQEAEDAAVGHEAPKVFRGVQVVLQEAVGGAAPPGGPGEVLTPGHHVDRRGLLPLVRPVEDLVLPASRLGVPPVVQAVAQKREEGPHPALPGHLPLGLGAQGPLQPRPEEGVEGLGLPVGLGDLLLERTPPGQAKVPRGLEGHGPFLQKGQELGAEEAALEAEGALLPPPPRNLRFGEQSDHGLPSSMYLV